MDLLRSHLGLEMQPAAGLTEIRYERPSERVARIVLARADKRNAQNMRMLYEINSALDRATQDDQVRVIIVAAEGPHFSSGHDLNDLASQVGDYGAPVTGRGGFTLPGSEGYFSREEEIYLGFCWRWRNLPKPTIAQVQGKAIAGGLMLIWPFDILIASEDAEFSDPVVAFGSNGHEFFVHAWEVGHRKAKEMLFTGEPITAKEGKELGMVNHVVPKDQLEAFTLAMADKIAQRPSIGLKFAKMSVNQSLDAQGMWAAVQSAFSLHHLAHAHNSVVHGQIFDPAGVDLIRNQARKKPG
jgi:enoyl-CoA hydratase